MEINLIIALTLIAASLSAWPRDTSFFHGRAAGMRTYGLIRMASAALTVITEYPGSWFGGEAMAAGSADPTKGQTRNGLVPIGLLAVALFLVVLRVVDVEIAFFGVAVFTVLSKQISLKDTYQAIEWPVIVLLGCLIP